MNSLTSFNPVTDRYHFDFGECSYERGFCQVDTEQDASYYGNWVNLTERKFVSYAEGDITRLEFENDDEMASYLRTFSENQNLGFLHVDPGFSDANEKKMLALGLYGLLPESVQRRLA